MLALRQDVHGKDLEKRRSRAFEGGLRLCGGGTRKTEVGFPDAAWTVYGLRAFPIISLACLLSYLLYNHLPAVSRHSGGGSEHCARTHYVRKMD